MRAISVHPAWAWLIVNGYKTIENRGWTTNRRERLLVHATGGNKRRLAALLEEGYQITLWVQRHVSLEVASKMPLPMSMPHGGIVGAVTLTGILPRLSEPSNPWHMPGHFGFVLADPEPLPFYPCQGALNLWGNFELVGGRVRQAA